MLNLWRSNLAFAALHSPRLLREAFVVDCHDCDMSGVKVSHSCCRRQRYIWHMQSMMT